MEDGNPYNQEVRTLFSAPVHAGDLKGDYPQVVVVETQESEQGARLVLSVGVKQWKIAEIRFRAWGCPHLLAGAEVFCSAMEGGPVDAFSHFGIVDLIEQLDVPVQKTGRMLLIEDVARKLAAAMA